MAFTHPFKVALRKSFDGLGVIDLEVPEFKDLNDTQKKRAVAWNLVANKKKEEKEMEILDAKEKKEAD